MPTKKSQRTMNILRSNRHFFQTMSSQVLELIKLPDEAVAELNVFGTKARLIDDGPVPMLLIHPRRVLDADAVLLHLHGGAYVSGDLLQCRMFFSPICQEAKLMGVTFAYRLAPEHPYPAQLDDAYAVYQLMLRHGVLPEKIGFVGESAGGNLALALCRRLRAEGLPLPGCLCLMSPWGDLAQTGESYQTLREVDATLNPENLMESALGFAGGDAERFLDPMISPIYADFTGFPPTQIHVGESELLLSDSETIAASMRRDGVPVTLLRYAGMPHVFQLYGFEESRASIKAMADYLAAKLTGKPRYPRRD